jgi:N-acetylmuramoyl-L-alanine amidase
VILLRSISFSTVFACGFLLAAIGLAGAAEQGAAGRTKTGAAVFPVASGVRLGGDENRTRFIVDLSDKIGLRAFTLANPDRVVIDIPQVRFELPTKTGDVGRGLVKAFRFGLVMAGGSRVVLDLTHPVRIERAHVLDAANGQPARLVLDLAKIDRDSFLRTIALENRSGENRKAKRAVGVTKPKQDDPRPLIVVDPGHGGIDFGTKARTGETEKEMVLAFGLMLRDKIIQSGKYRVLMTRTDDTFVALGERVNMARAREAALFISIHADALARGDGEARGATVYTLSETASDAEAARLAEAENKADIIAGVDLSSEPNDVADILIDLAQRETKTFSVNFARTLVGEMKNVARMHKNPIRAAGFRVLKAPDVPSVLVELGFVSDRQDLKLLTSDAWRRRAADSIVQAIDSFFAQRVAGTQPITRGR